MAVTMLDLAGRIEHSGGRGWRCCRRIDRGARHSRLRQCALFRGNSRDTQLAANLEPLGRGPGAARGQDEHVKAADPQVDTLVPPNGVAYRVKSTDSWASLAADRGMDAWT